MQPPPGRRPRLVIVPTVALVLTLSGPGYSLPASRTVEDPTGDVAIDEGYDDNDNPTYRPVDEPRADISRTAIRLTKRRVILDVFVPAGTDPAQDEHWNDSYLNWFLDIDRDGATEYNFTAFYDEFAGRFGWGSENYGHSWTCHGVATYRADLGRYRINAPQRCISYAKQIRARARIDYESDPYDPVGPAEDHAPDQRPETFREHFDEPLSPPWVRPERPAATRGRAWRFRSSTQGPGSTRTVEWGRRGGKRLLCDWDGNGTKTLTTFHAGVWRLRNSRKPGPPDDVFRFGKAGDTPLCGRWTAKRRDLPAVFRDGMWLLAYTRSGDPLPRTMYRFGHAGDVPVLGDWNGSGFDQLGVVRGDTWILDPGFGEMDGPTTFRYGGSRGRPVVGDWNGDGVDTPGVVVGRRWRLTNRLGGDATIRLRWGGRGDRPLAWR